MRIDFHPDFVAERLKAMPEWEESTIGKIYNELRTKHAYNVIEDNKNAEYGSEEAQKASGELRTLLMEKQVVRDEDGKFRSSALPVVDVCADIETTNGRYMTLLQAAAKDNVGWAIDPLLDAGAGINYTSFGTQLNAFEVACEHGHLDMAEYLRSKGATYSTDQIIKLALKADNASLLDKLKGWDSEVFTQEKLDTLVCDSVWSLSSKCMEWCIEQGANTAAPCNEGILVHVANRSISFNRLDPEVQERMLRIGELILQNPCNVNYQDEEWNTALYYALEKDAYALARMIAEHPDCDMETGNPNLSARRFPVKFNGEKYIALDVMTVMDKAAEKDVVSSEPVPRIFNQLFYIVGEAASGEKADAFEKLKEMTEKHNLDTLLGNPLLHVCVDGKPMRSSDTYKELMAEEALSGSDGDAKPSILSTINALTNYTIAKQNEQLASIKQSLHARVAKGEQVLQQYELEALCTLELFSPGYYLADFLEHGVFKKPDAAKQIYTFMREQTDEWKQKHASLVQRFEERARFADSGHSSGWARGAGA